MIKTKTEKVDNGVIQELEAKGSTANLLIELKALNIGVLSSLSFGSFGKELSIDERIALFCEIMKAEDDDG